MPQKSSTQHELNQLPAGDASKEEARHTWPGATGKTKDDGMIDTQIAPCAQDIKQGNNAEAAMSFAEYLLAELRAASLRAKILQSEIDAIGVALKGGIITAEQAIVLMHGVDLLRYIGEPADDVG